MADLARTPSPSNVVLSKVGDADPRSPWQGKVRRVLLIAAVSGLLALPMLLYGPLPLGHDTAQHLAFTKYFVQQFWAGDLYPRWLTDMNGGFGSPSFFIYPPFPAYVCALLAPVGNWLKFNAFNVSEFLALFGSGICAFVWLRTMVEQKAALTGAVLYMMMPYHLSVDLYIRCALPECWALVWMPLILYFTVGAIADKRRATLGLAVSFALLIFSHLITVLMFAPIPAALAAVLSKPGQRIRCVVRVVLAMLLGGGLSAVYLFPAVFHARYISSAKLVADYDWTIHILHVGKGLFIVSAPLFGRFLRWISWAAISMVAVAALCGASALKGKGRNSPIVFWLIVCAFSAFMMSELSAPLWRGLPRLQEAIQFPWRFNGVLCVAVLPILTVFLSQVSWKIHFPESGVLLAVLLILGAWLLTYGDVWRRYHVQLNEELIRTEWDGWFPEWSQPGTEYPSAPLISDGMQPSATEGSRVRFIDGSDGVDVLLWKSRHLEFRTLSQTGGWVTIDQFYYPAWKAELAADNTPILISAAMPQGLLKLWAPPGIQTVRLDIPISSAETFGKWISSLCLLLCAGIGLAEPPKGARDPLRRHHRTLRQSVGPNSGDQFMRESKKRWFSVFQLANPES
jgi:hypothetical protein